MATRTQLVIEGNLVTKKIIESGTSFNGSSWEKISTEKSIEINSWLEEVIRQGGEQAFTPQLAQGHLLARKSKGMREVAIIEFQPAVRRIIEIIDDHYNEHARLVSFPWVYLIVRFYNGTVDTMYVFYRNERAESVNADVYLPNLPNVHDFSLDFKVCTGNISGLRSEWSLSKKIDWLVCQFFDSVFNKDLLYNHWEPCLRLEGHPQSFADWEQRSKEDPKFILRINWRSLGKTLQQLLDEGVV